jgi:PKD repeat protein
VLLMRKSIIILFFPLILVLLRSASAAPAAAISASPTEGQAPLAVFFDGSLSSSDVVSYFWDFGDGSVSTAVAPSHIYNVAGTYTTRLTVSNSAKAEAFSEIVVNVTGSGEGPVTQDMNFRWATTASRFSANFAVKNKDKLDLNAFFNTVDLPGKLDGLAASFSVNNTLTISGVLGTEGVFENLDGRNPKYFVQISTVDQLLTVSIANADLSAALAASGVTTATSNSAGVPLTLSLTLGAQTYSITEKYAYKRGGLGGTGQFNVLKKLGQVDDGFFVIARASALENLDGNGHYYEFETFLSRPMLQALAAPTAGNWIFRFNEADPLVIPFDRIHQNGSRILYEQKERDLSGISHLIIDTETRRMNINTWDLPSAAVDGGTGLPVRGNPYTALNFTLRADLAQPDGTTFRAVTATRLSRRTQDDAFWQTGRRKKKLQ